jgi:recombination protein RecA
MAKKKKDKDETGDPLQDALHEIEEECGEGSIREGLESGEILKCDYIPTGALPLDVILGVGGLPKGRITEIYGPEGGGKTTMALATCANAQRAGGMAAYIDIEHAVDKNYSKKLGVDTDRLLFAQPDSGEQVFKIIEKLIPTGKVDIIVVDSVAALITQKELDGEVDDNTMAGPARLMSKALKRVNGPCRKYNVALVFINQIRDKIGITFGSPETTPGGRSLKFYASVRMDIRRIAGVKVSGEIVGNQVRCKIVKNKVAPPFRTAEFEIIFGKGINAGGALLELAVQHSIISQRGSNYYYDDKRLGSGKENVIKTLIGSDLEKKIYDELIMLLMPHLRDVGDADVDEGQDG